jgi:hypothetical protein
VYFFSRCESKKTIESENMYISNKLRNLYVIIEMYDFKKMSTENLKIIFEKIRIFVLKKSKKDMLYLIMNIHIQSSLEMKLK